MKIQVIIPDSLKNPMGGMGEQARQILSAFPEGYEFDVIGSNDDGHYQTSNYSFYPIIDIGTYHGMPEPIAHTFLNQSLYINESRKIAKPDIIHSFDWSTFWAGRILAKEYGIPLIVTIQLGISKSIDKQIHPIQLSNFQLAESIETSAILEADRIIQVSKSYANLYPSFLQKKTRIIPNGINLSEWKLNEKVELPGDRPIKLIYIGRFADMKNVSSIINADVPEEIDIIFIGCNKGGEADIHDGVIRACNENKYIHYVGPKYGQEKIDWLMSANAMIVPSIHEPFGIVGLEALASKNILLSSFVGGMGDYLTDNCAINCGTTPESISDALNKMVRLTENERKIYVKNGLTLCKEYAWETQANKLASVYREVKND